MCDEVVVIGIMPYPQTQFEQLRRVYWTGGCAPTIQSARNAQDTKSWRCGMCNIPLNTEQSGVFHCPVHHYSMCTFNEILLGFKERCDRQAGILIVYEL